MKSASCASAVLAAGIVFMVVGVRSVSALPDPCAVLTTAQVADALGVPVADGKHLATAVCQWMPTSDPPANTKKKSLTLTFQDARAFQYAKAAVPNSGIIKTPVTGIGDEAVLGTTPGAPTGLSVKKGEIMFVVHLFGFTNDEAAAKEKALALLILKKI